MTTKTTDLQWEIQAYGMTKAELNRMVKTQAFPGQELMFAAGMLSDAQQVLDPEFNAMVGLVLKLLTKHVNMSTVPRQSCLMSWTHHVVVQ